MKLHFKNITLFSFLAIALTACINEKIVTAPSNLPIVNNDKVMMPITMDSKIARPVSKVNYAKFSTYHWESGQHIQPAAGGVLVEKDGCLLIDSSGELQVPLLPHEVTSWDETTKTLTFFNKKIKIGERIFGAGRMFVEPNKPTVQFIQKVDPKCLTGRKYMVFWGV